MRNIRKTNQFSKDYKTVRKRGLNLSDLAEIIGRLANDETLPSKNRDHSLTGNYQGFRECHIHPDWLLIYGYEENPATLILVRTGTHSDLF